MILHENKDCKKKWLKIEESSTTNKINFSFINHLNKTAPIGSKTDLSKFTKPVGFFQGRFDMSKIHFWSQPHWKLTKTFNKEITKKHLFTRRLSLLLWMKSAVKVARKKFIAQIYSRNWLNFLSISEDPTCLPLDQ